MPCILCVFLAAGLLWSLFQMADQSVTLDHQMQHARSLAQQRDIAVEMLNALAAGNSEVEVLEALREIPGGQVFNKADGVVVGGQVSFEFEGGRLSRVTAGGGAN